MENINELIERKELELTDIFKEYDKIRRINQFKVIEACKNVKLSHADFNWSTGYGYGDIGREKVETIYSEIFKTEDALVRPSISSGTHALAIAHQAILRSGDEMVAITGAPYDTLQTFIGTSGDEEDSLIKQGVIYKELDLVDGKIDYDNIKNILSENTKFATIQRSIGYSTRRAFSIDEIGKAISIIKDYNKDIIVMVDNCYGEFTQEREPSEVGADMVVGSLIKNLGGGIAASGGYICGKKHLIEKCANRLTAPGLGKEVGLTFGTTRTTLQGLFMAPIVVNNAMKGAQLFGAVFKELGYKVVPDTTDNRSDIVQAIILEDPKKVIEFTKAIQESGTVDSYVEPTPWPMPGYEDDIIMAASGFIDGSSIEISADGPLRPPYVVFYQGGLSYDQCVYAVRKVLERFQKNGYLA